MHNFLLVIVWGISLGYFVTALAGENVFMSVVIVFLLSLPFPFLSAWVEWRWHWDIVIPKYRSRLELIWCFSYYNLAFWSAMIWVWISGYESVGTLLFPVICFFGMQYHILGKPYVVGRREIDRIRSSDSPESLHEKYVVNPAPYTPNKQITEAKKRIDASIKERGFGLVDLSTEPENLDKE